MPARAISISFDEEFLEKLQRAHINYNSRNIKVSFSAFVINLLKTQMKKVHN